MSWLVLFYLISLLLTVVCNKRNLWIVYMLVSIGIGVISFFYNPPETADLYRHIETIDYYKEVGLDWVIENRLYLDPLTHLFFYAFTFVGDPRCFSSFCTIVTYGFVLLLLYRVSIFYSLNKSVVVLLTMFLLFNWNYLLVASNCRIFMLYAIVAYFFYMELVENRFHKVAFLVYLASILFHYGILLVVIPRFVLYLYKPVNKKVYLWAILIIAFLVYIVISNYELIFLESVLNRVDDYRSYTVFGTWQFLNSLACVLVGCIFAIKRRSLLVDIKRYRALYWLIIVIVILNLSNFQVLYRESNLIASLSVVLFSRILNTYNDQSMKMIIGLQSIIAFVYSLVYVYPHMDFTFAV